MAMKEDSHAHVHAWKVVVDQINLHEEYIEDVIVDAFIDYGEAKETFDHMEQKAIGSRMATDCIVNVRLYKGYKGVVNNSVYASIPYRTIWELDMEYRDTENGQRHEVMAEQ